ncbi:nitrate- and nitrite sensing domain-containing protein [Micromonospora sp. CPCC 206061]|uniref:nitrate- and nitrite sensing domain-containing protein n=1 Tax=Micromonospora sp. CPCC 206061 TaxID=3122410 RepID=UPI002FF29A86
MSTGPTTLPASGVQAGGGRRFLPRLRDTKIRTKLGLILVVPVIAIVALAGVRLVDSAQRAADASLIRSLTRLSADVSEIAHEAHNERMAAARFLTSTNPAGGTAAFTQQTQRTDALVAAYTRDRADLGDVPAAVEDRLADIDDKLGVLGAIRQDVLSRAQRSPAEAVVRYTGMIDSLVEYPQVVGQIAGQGELADRLRAAAAFADLKAAVGDEQAVTYAALVGDGTLDREQYSAFVATLASQQQALEEFNLTADAAQQSIVGAAVRGDAVDLSDRVANQVAQSIGANRGSLNADEASSAVGAITNLMRFAEIRLQDQLAADADVLRADVVRQTVIESIVVLITLMLAITLAVVLVRSLNGSLRRLREGALAVANRDLPEAVAKLRDVRSLGEGGADDVVRQVRDAIRLPNRDEVGQVAQAFNVVHREAVRIAAEQAALRTSVSAMFLNLARRSQALVDRMIGELDMIERGEEDPKRLAQLFQLDHLATRMRRNDENLLVLAGADSTPPRRDDALLVDVLRAAQSEVELYNRIEFGTVDVDISVAAHAVNDVVRLLAELLDNATRFSPPNTVVVADARRIRDYVLLQIEDRGLGLTEDQLDALNRRLAQPPTVDVAAFRLMGLAVVGRLASRYGIRVELRPNAEGGTVAQITLPSGIVVLPKPRTREQVLSRPRSPLAVEPSPASSAPVSAGGWPQQSVVSALGARTSAATLSDPWPGSGARPDWNDNAVPVNAAAQTSTYPTLGESAAQAGLGSPTVAYPTVSGLPRRAGGATGQQETIIPATAHPMTPAMLPPAGLPSGPVAGPAAAAVREDAGEAPIFREMEAVWFRSHGSASTEIFSRPPGGFDQPPAAASPTAPPATRPTGFGAAAQSGSGSGFAPTNGGQGQPPRPPVSPPAAYSPPPVPPVAQPAPAAEPVVPRQRLGTEDGWRTAADEGWKRAERASQPQPAGTTRSGLPKRTPQAQLVPGGVESKTGREKTRRTPDEVRGLLSAYHRGVQRGRSAGKAPSSNSTKETSG